jgi:Cu(I)/Ag(I) efflux system membrane protein CusA/SilA
MRRIALPLLGGTASTLLLTLIVIPAIYYIRVGSQLSARAGTGNKDAHPLAQPTEGETV